jgi:hypothetical protein
VLGPVSAAWFCLQPSGQRLTRSISYSPALFVQSQKGQTIALSPAIFVWVATPLFVGERGAVWEAKSLSQSMRTTEA